MATPLLAPDGSLIAAISAAVDVSPAHRLDDIGEELKSSVAASARNTGSTHAEKTGGTATLTGHQMRIRE